MRQQGGIAIAAHISEKNGLLRVLGGKPRVRAWRDENLLAVQIPGAVADLHQGDRKIVENKDPEYHRVHAPEKRLAVAVLNAKDVVKPDTLSDPAASCLLKCRKSPSKACVKRFSILARVSGSTMTQSQSNIPNWWR